MPYLSEDHESYHKKYRELNKEERAAKQREYYRVRKEKDPDYNHKTNLEFRLRHPKRYILQSAKSRAKTSGLEFNITENDFEIPEICPALSIPIFVQAGKGKSPNSPSLDRIDSSKGYIKGNVQVLSWRANNLKSDGTPGEFKLLSEFLNDKTKT